MKSNQRILKRKLSPKKSLTKTDQKTRSQISGTFHFQARREEIIEEAPTLSDGTKYIKEGGEVINFGGEVMVMGDFTLEEKQELLRLVENIGAVSARRDPNNRIIRIKSERSGFTVYTSKSNLAVAIGKKIHRARKHGELVITWSRHDLPVRVSWQAT
jgi:hypothetical protein